MSDFEKVNAFFSRVNYSDSCWEWQGYKQQQGYGLFFFNYKHTMAHRWSYEYFREPLGNLLCCHHCDNPSCVNPFHLFAGTMRDNAKDMASKGRQARQNKNKTHCVKGHALTTNNIYNYKGWQYCKTCNKLNRRKLYMERGI